MKTKLLSIMSLIVVAMCAMFISCSEDMGYGEKTNENVKAVVKMAKQMYESSGSVVSLPNPSANKHAVSRSAMTHLADLTPMWDEAFTHEQGHETIVIVPLQGENEIRSTVSISEGDETTYQFAKVFSRMIVKPSEGDNGIYVLSYMPESNYAATHANLESEMGYNPTDVDFTGLIVSSRLNGEVMMGFLYESGELNHYFAPATHECADHNCSENHNHEHKGLSLSFNLQNASHSNVATYSGRSEDYECPNCHKIGDKCECYDNIFFELCDKCGNWKFGCICPTEEEAPCPNCGIIDGCGCSKCPTCFKYFCICNKPVPPPSQDPCEKCDEYYCICVKNTTPIQYQSHHNDYFVQNGMTYSIEDNYGCSIFAALEMACYRCGSTLTQDDLYQNYIQTYHSYPNESTEFNVESEFIKNNFYASRTTNITNTLVAGYPVIVRFDNSFITVIGIQYDEDLIYANHKDSRLYVVEKDYFKNCENIVIEGVILEDNN